MLMTTWPKVLRLPTEGKGEVLSRFSKENVSIYISDLKLSKSWNLDTDTKLSMIVNMILNRSTTVSENYKLLRQQFLGTETEMKFLMRNIKALWPQNTSQWLVPDKNLETNIKIPSKKESGDRNLLLLSAVGDTKLRFMKLSPGWLVPLNGLDSLSPIEQKNLWSLFA